MQALTHSPRPRTHRRPTGKPIKLTPRALDIFDRLDRNGMLPTNYLHAFLGGNLTNLSNRLGDLYHEDNTPPYFTHYLDRPEGQWRSMNARYVHATYSNTAAAERALSDNGREIRSKANLSNSFFHDLMACVLGAAFELSARTESNIVYLSWEDIRDHERTPEKTRHSRAPFNIPLRRGDLRPDDRPFGLQYTRPDGRKRTLVFAGIEADRSTEPLRPTQLRHSSMAQKFRDYAEFIDREIYALHFGFPMVPLVPIVTVSEARMRNMMMLAGEIAGARATKYFLFRALPVFASFEQSIPVIDDLLTHPWQRVGADPIRMVDILKR
jgi:hypothetical protein